MAKVLTIVSTGAKTTATGVRGVKGAAETEYRDGYVNITPADIGFSVVELEEASGTLTQDELKVLKNNMHNLIGYAPEENQVYIFRLVLKQSTKWVYSANKIDLTGTMFVNLNITTGAYVYSVIESETQVELETHVADSAIHVSDEDRISWDSKVSASVEPDGGTSGDNTLILR